MSSGILVVLCVHNEKTLLPYFLRHYSFADKILIWDNGSTDQTPAIAAAHPSVELRRFKTDAYDEASVLERLHASLREHEGLYRWCLLPDCDEFIVHTGGQPIATALEAFEEFDIVVPRGFNLIRHPDEKPLHPGASLVGQRRYGYLAADYDKPIIIRPTRDITFVAGKHELRSTPKGFKIAQDPRFALLHHDMIDFDLWVYRKTKRPLSAHNVAKGWCVKRFCRDESFYRKQWKAELARAEALEGKIPVLRHA